MHPGVLDKGNYNMFATPRSIIPGQPEAEEIPEVEVYYISIITDFMAMRGMVYIIFNIHSNLQSVIIKWSLHLKLRNKTRKN